LKERRTSPDKVGKLNRYKVIKRGLTCHAFSSILSTFVPPNISLILSLDREGDGFDTDDDDSESGDDGLSLKLYAGPGTHIYKSGTQIPKLAKYIHYSIFKRLAAS
jgi:hypothetical protein